MPDQPPFPPPCIHSPDGRTLCPACAEDYRIDPQAYLEYGLHPAGQARWAELQAEMDRDRAEAAQDPTPPEAWDGIPF